MGDEAPSVMDVDYFKDGFSAIQQLINEGLILSGHDISAGGMVTALLELCFANKDYGLKLDVSAFEEDDLVKLLFSENPGVIIQVRDLDKVNSILDKYELSSVVIGAPVKERSLTISGKGDDLVLDIDSMRDLWYKSSYLLDRHQSGEFLAGERYANYKNQPLSFRFPESFKGSLESLGLDKAGSTMRKAKAAIIREKGVNGDREMAYSLYLAGFDVKDVHMTDLISGREDLSEIDFVVYVGGFSNSDVLGSAKGWAGAFMYNEQARKSLDAFYKRKDTLSLGVCNGCQLMVELGLVYPEHDKRVFMSHNDSHKFESTFINMEIVDNNSVMLSSLAGSRLGVWIAHGEGKFNFPLSRENYNIHGYYGYQQYPGNPNGSDYSAAAICSHDGRHLAMMPHPERAILPWQWAYYPEDRKNDEVSPWLEAFVNARKWVEERK